MSQEVKDEVLEVLDSGHLTEGSVTKQFENSIKDYIGCKHALAVSNCTVGLEVALRALGIGQGDEVIVPDYTYPATAAVVSIVGATIVLVDVDPDTMLIDYEAIEKAISERTKAIIPVSIFGNPLDYDRLWNLRERYNLYLIEDAACSIGAQYDGDFVGNLADISVFSFHPRKFITTGEGGMITTNNSEWAAWMDSYKHFGMSSASSRLDTHFERIGTNYKLSNVQAAIGLVQMRHIASLLQRRTQLANRYHALLTGFPGISFPKVTPKGIHSWQSFCVFTSNRDYVIARLEENNIETQIGTYALHMHQAYSRNPNCRIVGDMSGSRYAFDYCLTLPLYQDMTTDQQEYVVKELLGSIN
jgi:dTDP-4-amino-4,6-dideoxygalactose transaminase